MNAPHTLTCALDGCNKSIAGRRENTKFCDDAHRQESYRRRVKAAAKANGLPVTLSLESVQTTNPPRKRSGDAPKPRKSGQSIRISYRKAVDAVGQAIGDGERAQEMLMPLLTDRQKAALRVA